LGEQARREPLYVLLGSCKWRRNAGIEVLSDLRRRQSALGPAALDARLAVFARERFTTELRRVAEADEVLLVTAADLFC